MSEYRYRLLELFSKAFEFTSNEFILNLHTRFYERPT